MYRKYIRMYVNIKDDDLYLYNEKCVPCIYAPLKLSWKLLISCNIPTVNLF